VETNDPKQKKLTLKISGRVEKFAIIAPRHAKLSGPVGKPLKAVVTVFPEEKYPFKIVGAKAEKGNFIKFTFKEITRENRTAYQLTVENTKDTEGRYFDTIRLTTDNKIQQEIGIWVFGDIKGKKDKGKK
jgi:hypothetical protein